LTDTCLDQSHDPGDKSSLREDHLHIHEVARFLSRHHKVLDCPKPTLDPQLGIVSLLDPSMLCYRTLHLALPPCRATPRCAAPCWVLPQHAATLPSAPPVRTLPRVQTRRLARFGSEASAPGRESDGAAGGEQGPDPDSGLGVRGLGRDRAPFLRTSGRSATFNSVCTFDASQMYLGGCQIDRQSGKCAG